MKAISALALFLIWISVGISATSTSCIKVPLCSQFGSKSNPIFIARVTNVDQRYAYLKVQQVFVGSVPDRLRMPVDGGGELTFSKAKTYLIVAEYYEGELVPTTCGATAELSDADPEDLAYLRFLSGSAQEGWIQGVVWFVTNAHPETRPVAGIPIQVKSASGIFNAVTNQAGKYKVSGLVMGKYTVEAQLPADLKVAEGSENPAVVEVANQQCSETWLKVETDKPIGVTLSGKLVGGGARDYIDDIPIKLQSANSKPGAVDWIEFEAKTDEQGQFKFENIPAGKYLLAANLGFPPSDTDPYPTVYYAGSQSEEGATIVDVGNDSLNDLDIPMPQPIPEEDVRVNVRKNPSIPSAQAYLEFVGFKDKFETGPDLKSDGVMVFNVPFGYRYRAHAVGKDSKGQNVCAEPIEFTAEKGALITLTLSRRGLDCDLESYVVDSK